MRSDSYPHQWGACNRPVIPAGEKPGNHFPLLFRGLHTTGNRGNVRTLPEYDRVSNPQDFTAFAQSVVFQIKRAANLQIILAPYKIDVVLQPHYPETLLHITRTKILPCKLIAQEYSVSSYENGSSSSSIWQA